MKRRKKLSLSGVSVEASVGPAGSSESVKV